MRLVSDALAIARAGVRSVDPTRAVARVLERRGRNLRLEGRPIPVGPGAGLRLVAIGKASGALFDAVARISGRSVEGIAVLPKGYPRPRRATTVVEGNHPVPERDSFAAGRALLDYVRSIPRTDSVLFLLSGGGSAVADVPTPDLRDEDLTATTHALLASGAPIGPMNAIRRHLSQVKGGRLAAATEARWRGTIAISDVVGDPPHDIASGPTVPDPTSFADARAAVRRYALAGRLPSRVLRRLRTGPRAPGGETPKPHDPRLRSVPFVLAATNRIALEGARAEAQRRGYRTTILTDRMVGETRPVAERFATDLVSAMGARPVALLAGGETTVTLGPRPGRGGRNQEFAVASASVIVGRPTVVLSVGTDGIDGPTDAAGGWADGATLTRAHRARVDWPRALGRHAGYAALDRVGELLRTGPSGTNVMDLHIGLARPYAPRYRLTPRRGVVAGPAHWEFPARGGRLAPGAWRWLQRSGVGIRAIHRPPAPGRPYWDQLIPWEV